MIKRMVTSALFAGLVAGLFAAVLHFAFVQKLLLLAEDYETGAIVHFAGLAEHADGHDHEHDEPEAAPPAMKADDGHTHSHAAEQARSPLQRNSLTVLFFIATYASYGLIMGAGFGLAEAMGQNIGLREGLLWGIAGYAAFHLAPAMGLPPELPGTTGPDLAARQIWWWGTACATAAGIALLGYGKGLPAWGAAVLLLALPHIIAAPQLLSYTGVAPPELAAAFTARGLGAGLAIWAVLGALAGWLWSRSAAD